MQAAEQQLQAAAAGQAPANNAALQAQATANGGVIDSSSDTNGPTNPIPRPTYYKHFALLNDGEYKKALQGFQSDMAYGLRVTSTRAYWVDAICYHTMIGESYYKMGKLSDALDSYNAALKLYLAFPNWMNGVRFPPTIPPQPVAASTPWGRSARGAMVGHLPVNLQTIPNAIVIDPIPSPTGTRNSYGPPALPVPLNVGEVVRCTTLAMMRRRELMGPVAQQDKMSQDLVDLLLRHPAPGGVCTNAWIDAELAVAYLGVGQTGPAQEYLKRSVSMPGNLDHVLTPLVLLELGELSLQSGDVKTASHWFGEASFSAFQLGDMDSLEEAFRDGQRAHMMADPHNPGAFEPLGDAIPWSRSQSHGRELHASLLLAAAENSALSTQPGAATSLLADARGLITSHDMAAGEIGARLKYISALVAYRQGNVRAGDAALGDALAFEKTGSKWLFQIGLADYYVQAQKGPHIGSKRALPMLNNVLREPTSADWAADPLEALAVLESPQGQVYDHWFEASLSGGVEASLEAADRARRHRFLSTLPLGGRLLALRWTLEAPADSLSAEAQLQRQTLLANYAKYAELAKQVAALRAEVAAAPLSASGAEAERKQAAQLAEIGRISSQQETMLREMAVRREGVDLAFPPLRSTKEIQAALAPRQLLLMFFSSGNNMYAWFMSHGRCAAWKLDSPTLETKTAALLRAMGSGDAIREVPQKLLADDDAWRHAAREMTDAIVADSKINLNGGIDELIVVPDGVLWYLPFETLQIPAENGPAKNGQKTVSLISKTRVRYLPTMGLAMPGHQDRRATDQMGVVLGKLGAHDDPAAMQAELTRLGKVAPHVWPMKSPLPAASPVYGALFDTLVVFDDLAASEKAAGGDKGAAANYDWSPIPLDRVKSSGSLSQWFALPWKGPTQIILPGFHTPAETGLRQQASGPAGNDLFLSVCGLMSTGARTVLISRWRTGGQSSEELVRQFAQELPFSGAADAWQRGVQLLADDPVEVEQEPRVQRAPAVDGLTARHPFFWSGYMLVDTGWTPPADKQIAAAKK